MAPLFASTTDLGILSQDPVDPARANLVLTKVSADIREGTGWPVTNHAGQVSVTGDHVALVLIPAMHVTSVSQVTADGVELVADQDYTWDADGIVRLVKPACRVIVAYQAGWPADQVPEVFRSVCLDHALLSVDNPTGERSWSLGDESHTSGGVSVGAAKDDPRLDRYRIRGGNR